MEGREPLLLPLLHALHLQAEGGEAGQEVSHLIHLRDKRGLCHRIPRPGSVPGPRPPSQYHRPGQALPLLQGMWWLHCDCGQLPKGQSSTGGGLRPREKGHQQLQRKWAEADVPGAAAHSHGLFCDEGLAAQGGRPVAPARPRPGPAATLTCSLVLVIWRRVHRSSSRSRCSCRPRRSRYSLSIWMI